MMINSGRALSAPSAPLGPTPSSAAPLRLSQVTRAGLPPCPRAREPAPGSSPSSSSPGVYGNPHPLPTQSSLPGGARRGRAGGPRAAAWRPASPGARGQAVQYARLPSPPERPRVHPGLPQRPACEVIPTDVEGAGAAPPNSRRLESRRLECFCLARPLGKGILFFFLFFCLMFSPSCREKKSL